MHKHMQQAQSILDYTSIDIGVSAVLSIGQCKAVAWSMTVLNQAWHID